MSYQKYIWLIIILSAYNSCVMTKAEQGLELFDKKQYDSAITYYSNLVTKHPNNSEVLVYLGIAYSEKREYDSSILWYDKALLINKWNINAYVNKGNALLEKGEIDSAFKNVEKALAIKKKYSPIHIAHAFCFMEKGLFKETINEFLAGIEYWDSRDYRVLNYSLPMTYIDLALTIMYLGDNGTAAQYFQKAEKMGYDQKQTAEYYMGKCYLALHQNSAADVVFKRILENNESELKYRYLIYQLTKNNKDFNFPVPDTAFAERALLKKNKNTQGVNYYNLSCYYSLGHNMEKARLYLTKAIKNNFKDKMWMMRDNDIDAITKTYNLDTLLKSNGDVYKEIVSKE